MCDIISKGENSLHIKEADVDGIQIVETDTGNKVYVYYSELPLLINILKKYYSGNIAHAKKDNPKLQDQYISISTKETTRC